jgi:hypothetical protein
VEASIQSHRDFGGLVGEAPPAPVAPALRPFGAAMNCAKTLACVIDGIA